MRHTPAPINNPMIVIGITEEHDTCVANVFETNRVVGRAATVIEYSVIRVTPQITVA